LIRLERLQCFYDKTLCRIKTTSFFQKDLSYELLLGVRKNVAST
jgi:hypothetical protein